jgi:hypothetical protein
MIDALLGFSGIINLRRNVRLAKQSRRSPHIVRALKADIGSASCRDGESPVNFSLISLTGPDKAERT